MAKKIVDSIRRTGKSTSTFRQIVVVQGEGKDARETVLSTPIEKVVFGKAFRNGGAATPIEQYGFKVGTKTYERFADAASVVLKKHNIDLLDASEAQAYVQKAFRIIQGLEELRLSQEPEVAVGVDQIAA